MAHIGVLRVLLRAGVEPDLIVGSSMGAIIGAGFALLGDIDALEKKAKELVNRVPQLDSFANLQQMSRGQRHVLERIFNFLKELYILNVEATRKSLLDRELVQPLLEEIFDAHRFEDLKFPFAAVATDLQTGEEVILREGKLVPALMASSAIPGIFEPVEWNGRILVDGAVTSTVPVNAVREMGADYVIAVNVEADIRRRNFERGVEILFQVDDIRGAELNRLKLREADIVIEPRIGHVNWAQFAKIGECISRGEEAAQQCLPAIRSRIRGLKRKFWKRFF